MSVKNPVTLPGTDPETVRLVVQRLKHYTSPGPSKEEREKERKKLFDRLLTHVFEGNAWQKSNILNNYCKL